MGVLDIFKSSSRAVDTAASVVDKTADGIIGGIDKLFYTDQEKAEARQKAFDGQLAFQEKLMSESLPSAVSRRILAWMIAGVFLSLVVFGVALYKVDQAWSKFIFEQGVGRLEMGFSAVTATYFLTQTVRAWAKK